MLVKLDWDSDHFGFRVARSEPSHAPVDALRADLERAREEGVRLVYAFRDAAPSVPAELLDEFGGRAVCTQVAFRKLLLSEAGPPAPEGIRIERFTATVVPEDLQALAIEAGGFSRFRLDPGIPRPAFEALYRTWCERSVRGELADHVLVAHGESGDRLGLVSVARSDDPECGRIGLLSVNPRWHRFGIATALMSAAEDRMREAGCREAMVVTQQENVEVCRFYRSCGYREESCQRAFHFWLGEAAS